MSAPDSNLADARQLLREMVTEAQGLKAAAGGSVTDAVAAWLAPQYLLAARERLGGVEGSGRWEILRSCVQDWALLRRGDHSAARLQLEREELDLVRANRQTQKEKEFREWLKRPDIRQELFPGQARGLSEEQFERIGAELHLL